MRRTDAEDRAYHRGMSRLAADRGFLSLSQAHALAAQDCPENCRCSGCLQTRTEVAEALERRKRTWARVARTAAVAMAAVVMGCGCGGGAVVDEHAAEVAQWRQDRAAAYADCKAMCPVELTPAIVPDRYNAPLCACVPAGALPLRSAPGTYGTAKTRSIE